MNNSLTDGKKAKPTTWVPSAYFAMGLPFVALSTVSVLLYSDLGISNTMIALWTSLVMLPWTLKPLWSSFLEMFRTKKYFVVLTQISTGLLFGLLALSLAMPHFFVYGIALMAMIAFSGATNDIVTDGIYMTELDSIEQAKYIGWQGAFYNLAKILTTGGLVYLAGVLKDALGAVTAWMIIMGACGTIMLLLGIYHLKMIPTGGRSRGDIQSSKEAMQELKIILASFFTKRYIALYIAFIIIYRFAEGFAIKIVPLFLKAPVSEGGLGLSTQQIGMVYGTFGAAAFVIGSILGGYFISRYGLKRKLFTLCCAFNIPFAVYLILAIYQPSSLAVIGSAIVFEYFGYGFGFVGLSLFMMQQIAPGNYQMSHYAFATAIMNLGVMIPGMMSGWLSDKLGYCNFFIMVMIITIPAFLITKFLPFTYEDKPSKQ